MSASVSHTPPLSCEFHAAARALPHAAAITSAITDVRMCPPRAESATAVPRASARVHVRNPRALFRCGTACVAFLNDVLYSPRQPGVTDDRADPEGPGREGGAAASQHHQDAAAMAGRDA